MRKIFVVLSLILLAGSLQSFGQAGTLDSTFGVNGKIQFFRDNLYISTIAIQPDGKIIGGGYYKNSNNILDFCLARFNSDGTIDSSFAIDGISPISVTASSDRLNVLALQSDGKIVIGGYVLGIGTSVQYVAVFRCKADGSLDSSFADNGSKIISLPGTNNEVRAIDIEAGSDKILLGVTTGSSGPLIPGVIRLNSNGTYDSSFANDGVYLAANSNLFSLVNALKVQTDNKVLVMSFQPDSFSVVRFNESGVLDNTFGNGGVVKTSFGNGIYAANNAMTLQQDGKIVLVGHSASSSQTSVALARYNNNGILDNTFGIGGKVISTWGSNYTDAICVAVQPSDNKIIICGKINNNQTAKKNFLVQRFNPNGSLDTEFGDANGRTITTFSQSDDIAFNVFVLPDGKVLVCGVSTTNPDATLAMARYNSCGISITANPTNQTALLGATSNFTANSTSPSASYQWQTKATTGWENLNNGGQYSGTQNSILHIANVSQTNDQQQFRTIAISGVCTDTSSAAILTVDTTTGINQLRIRRKIKMY